MKNKMRKQRKDIVQQAPSELRGFFLRLEATQYSMAEDVRPQRGMLEKYQARLD